jgi:hypothetical protein
MSELPWIESLHIVMNWSNNSPDPTKGPAQLMLTRYGLVKSWIRSRLPALHMGWTVAALPRVAALHRVPLEFHGFHCLPSRSTMGRDSDHLIGKRHPDESSVRT